MGLQPMTLEEQEKIIAMWQAYMGDQHANQDTDATQEPGGNRDMVSFYVEIVRECPFYRYGMAYEVFDIIVNGPFDPQHASLERYAERINLDRTAA